MGNPHALQTTDVVDFRTDQRLSRGTRAFLKALNTPMPPELEKLAPIAARDGPLRWDDPRFRIA